MPIYEYMCPECDSNFTELKPIAKFNHPAFCPHCANQGHKVISAPHLNTMRADRRFAHETNERSAHEPKVKHSCGTNCHHKKEHTPPTLKQQQNKRPWMLGH